MRIYRCWFCSSPIYPGHGVMFVRNDSKEFRFCRGKCHKAFKKKRNPRKVKWTKIYRKTHNKELTDDIVLTFERKKNTVPKYDRETLLKTVNAMERIEEIKKKREGAFVRKRLIKGIEDRKADDRRLVETSMHLIRASNARDYVAKKRKAPEIMDASSEDEESEEEMDVDMAELEKATAPETRTQKKKVEKRRKLLASY
ncbi:hypothetical protein Ciccas_011454 [Cichlidogyrus casuarinus]|uniref:Probable ribosome biogenesis protein RLP24 n=1 Tax=Cichlidogyrus casuarinus TaxID=1844966 RepID=A0ABD2PR84_9PLAT